MNETPNSPSKAADFDNPEAVRAIAFYLPQFHPIPENDEWWGKGFTEWTKVSRAAPLFAGHYQPHLPADLGFYDLRVPEVRAEQAALARKYGISGFCYYHYWFAGKRLLERPFADVLKSGEPDFPFCLCWANENWTRRWDGKDQEILIAQKHSPEDDLAFIRDIIPAFRDPRYIRIHGRPLLLVYRVGILPQPQRTAELWRRECMAAGVGNPYLCMVQTSDGVDPRTFGFDAAVEFPPLNISLLQRPTYPFKGNLGLYEDLIEAVLERPAPAFTWFRGVIPSWDNTPRRGEAGMVIHGSRPQLYDHWLTTAVRWTREHRGPGERLVFINAWNEWAEGCHLEPDAFFGHGFLEATRAVMLKEGLPSNENINQLLQEAVAHVQADRLTDAEAAYQQVLALQPNHPGALHVLGLLKYQNGDMQRAIELIEKAAEVNPDFADAHKNAANIYAETGQLDKAIAKYRQALSITPDLVEAHVNLGTVYQTLLRFDEARKHYEAALSIDPSLVEARDKLAEVLRILAQANG
jgi:lipopolysaccharide biosynthesis protein